VRWLLTDFGFTTANEGLTQFSVARRGTSGFRAPELLNTDADDGQFSRKSDVWAMGCILFQLATTAKASAFKDDWFVMAYSHGYDVCPQIDDTANQSLNRDIYCPDEKSKTTCLSQINSVLALCFAREPSARATTMKLKVTFERMKAYLMDDMNEDERKRWL
jgi:serine/threonine protein kinase